MVTKIRNVAIIAHVDHGKTTLVDGLLKQSNTFRENEAVMNEDLILDSNDQEKERGITILAKNTAINHKETKINIIDTPGHADFGGEVERSLSMADGAILVIDAQEGPMPQTKFVLKKALDQGLKIIVVINKIDKKASRTGYVIEKTNDLFLDLAIDEAQLDFPILYAIAKQGKAWTDFPEKFDEKADLTPIFDAILEFVPPPKVDINGSFQMLVSALDWDSFQGKYGIGKICRGIAKTGLNVSLVNDNGVLEKGRITSILINQGLRKIKVAEAQSGDIVAISGLKNSSIGNTITDSNNPEKLPSIKIEEPTLKMTISVNTSPYAGTEGEFCTNRQILDRINKELETNVSLKLEIGSDGKYILSGRGELHLSVFIEKMRREGFEMEISQPLLLVLYISVLGMGLVFGAIGLMWAALAFMVFLTSSKQTKKSDDISSEYKEKDDDDLKVFEEFIDHMISMDVTFARMDELLQLKGILSNAVLSVDADDIALFSYGREVDDRLTILIDRPGNFSLDTYLESFDIKSTAERRISVCIEARCFSLDPKEKKTLKITKNG